MSHRHLPWPDKEKQKQMVKGQYKDIKFMVTSTLWIISDSARGSCRVRIQWANKHEWDGSPCSRTCQRPRQSQSTLPSVPWRSWCELWPLSSPQRIGTVPPMDFLYILKTQDEQVTQLSLQPINYRRNSPEAQKDLLPKKDKHTNSFQLDDGQTGDKTKHVEKHKECTFPHRAWGVDDH